MPLLIGEENDDVGSTGHGCVLAVAVAVVTLRTWVGRGAVTVARATRTFTIAWATGGQSVARATRAFSIAGSLARTFTIAWATGGQSVARATWTTHLATERLDFPPEQYDHLAKFGDFTTKLLELARVAFAMPVVSAGRLAVHFLSWRARATLVVAFTIARRLGPVALVFASPWRDGLPRVLTRAFTIPFAGPRRGRRAFAFAINLIDR